MTRTRPKQKQTNPLEGVVDSFRRTGRASGETGGPDDNGPEVDYSDMGNVNVGGDRDETDDEQGTRER